MSAYDYLLDRVRESQERERAAKMEADRCQQLAALEAEIGRAVIGYDFVHYALGDKSYEPNLSPAYMLLCMEKANLIARWRELHAEGAEAEAATERQEGER